MGGGDQQQVDGAEGGALAEECVRADGAGAEEGECKRAEELGDDPGACFHVVTPGLNWRGEHTTAPIVWAITSAASTRLSP